MNERAIIRRKLQLKSQALELIRAQRRDLIYRLALLGLKDSLEVQIKTKFDPVLSRKLDCVRYLLEHSD